MAFIGDVKFPQLAGLTVASTELVLKDGSLTDMGLCCWTTFLSAMVCLTMYKLGKFVTPLFFSSYKTLSREDQRNWDTRPSSMIHSYLCVHFAYVLLVADDYFYKAEPGPSMLRTSRLSYAALGVSLGYFFIDFFCCVKYWMGGMEMVLHHIGSLTTVVAAIVVGQCHQHAMWMLITEFTTPFINFRWWFDKTGMKTSPLYFWNGMAITLSWVFARILLFPPFFYLLWTQRDQWQYLLPISKVFLCIFPPVLTLLNWYWFLKIVRGALKLLNKKPEGAAKKQE